MPLLELTVDSKETSLDVRRFDVQESISGLFSLSVRARSPNADLDLESIVGKPASFRVVSGVAFARAGARFWTGVCSHIEQLQAETTGLSTYQLRIMPTLWLLTQRRNHRIYQHLTIPDIADKILAEWEITPTWSIDRGKYPKLEYRCQYGESDYTFLTRLLEEAGIAFTYPVDDAQGSVLTLADKLHLGAPRPGPARGPRHPRPRLSQPRLRPARRGAQGSFSRRQVRAVSLSAGRLPDRRGQGRRHADGRRQGRRALRPEARRDPGAASARGAALFPTDGHVRHQRPRSRAR